VASDSTNWCNSTINNAVNASSAHKPSIKKSEVEKPIPAEARGRASMPAPIVVPAMIKVLPKTFDLFIVYNSLRYGVLTWHMH
jgi:hypothetical protein